MECMRRPMLNNSAAGEAVYKPFCGSGTTIIAAETTGRRCLAMEIDPAMRRRVERWQGFTGGRASPRRRGPGLLLRRPRRAARAGGVIPASARGQAATRYTV